MIAHAVRTCFPLAAQAVADKAEDINKLNVFPVPDGDTGTNMSLTLATVVSELEALPQDATMADIAQAITHGSLMGARGNSGVITSQILRGLAEGLIEANDEEPTSQDIARAFAQSQKVAFQAVRKPVEGTILTVLRDVATQAEKSAKEKKTVQETLSDLVVEAYESVARTPDLLPVLKENGVVDSGAYGFATFLEAFVNSLLGYENKTIEFETHVSTTDTSSASADEAAKDQVASRVAIELNDDWEGSEYRYCTEFLFHADSPRFNEEKTLKFLSSMGDCELLVGANPDYKIHVHTNTPDKVLARMLKSGQIFEVFIHNMDLEAQDRTAKIAADQKAQQTAESQVGTEPSSSAPSDAAVSERNLKELGFVAVAAGSGQADILNSLGVDVVVSGGQTMNPSTADILAAIEKVAAKEVIVLPNNSNIRMAAEAAAAACDSTKVYVVPTKSVLQAFSAMLAADPTQDGLSNTEAMTEALGYVRDGEITSAVRDSTAADGSPIHAGDVMGIAGDSIDIVGSDVTNVALDLLSKMMDEEEGDTLTLLAGADMTDDDFANLEELISERFPDLEIDAHRGEQPLYPVIFAIE